MKIHYDKPWHLRPKWLHRSYRYPVPACGRSLDFTIVKFTKLIDEVTCGNCRKSAAVQNEYYYRQKEACKRGEHTFESKQGQRCTSCFASVPLQVPTEEAQVEDRQ